MVSYKSQRSVYRLRFHKLNYKLRNWRVLYFLWLKVVSLTLILYQSAMRGECVLNIYAHSFLFPERFQQVLENMTDWNIPLDSWTEDDSGLLQRRAWWKHRHTYRQQKDNRQATEIYCSNERIMTAERAGLTWFSSWVTLICSLRIDVRAASSFLIILSFFSSGLQKLLMLLVEDPSLLSFKSSSLRSSSFSLCISLSWACISSSSPPLPRTACLSRAEGTPWWWWWWCSMEREPRSL